MHDADVGGDAPDLAAIQMFGIGAGSAGERKKQITLVKQQILSVKTSRAKSQLHGAVAEATH